MKHTLIQSIDVLQLFPTTVVDLQQRVAETMNDARERISALVVLPAERRTFANTAHEIDRVAANLHVMTKVVWTLHNVSPDASLREAAQEALPRLQNFSLDMLENNPEVYRALKEYADNVPAEPLTDEEKKYLADTLKKFEKQGMALPAEKQHEVRELKKEIARLCLALDTNIMNDNRTVTVTEDELRGCSPDFIAGLQRDSHGMYVVGVDYPTYFTVMDSCAVESTRKALWTAFNNRAYPANEQVLKDLIAARHAWAQALGFTSYAQGELADEMAQSPEMVCAFLAELFKRSAAKTAEEVAALKAELPESVTLTPDGRFKPWDVRYVQAQYKKKHHAFDEEKIKEYFPMEKTLKEMLDVYRQFFGVEFRQEPVPGLWHPDALYVGVYDQDGSMLGHILLDMYPRPNKYSHGCMECIVPAVRGDDGSYHPPVIIIITNFTQPTADRPALFSQEDVFTLFHEFGHAVHGLFGATRMAAFSGTNVKLDFVEMPSQMLEEWLYDPVILKKMSGHYITGEPLPDGLIASMIQLKKCGSGLFARRQVMQGLLSLALFEEGADKHPAHVHKALFEEIMGDYIAYDGANNFHASFGHLAEYGSRYYCYMWSKVYALDMFNHIKKQGLLNNEIGRKYIEHVIGKGGSSEPEKLLLDFLGRQPDMEAFFEDFGF